MDQSILDQLNEVILLFNMELELTYINTAGEMLFDDSARHLIGTTASNLFRTADTAIIHSLRQCLKRNDVLVDRDLNIKLPNKRITVNLSATPLFENNIRSGIILELQPADRHMRISKEEQLLAQQNTARMLVRGLAHEIKNPLGGIRGAAQLLDIELQDPNLKEYTQIIIDESDRMRELMDRMLGPNAPPNKTETNIHEVIERVRSLVHIETTRNILIQRDYDPSIPIINADQGQLIQAILNIVRNAVQALGPEGRITLKTRIRRQMTIGRKYFKLVCKIDVIDNGPGIKPEIMSQIFYPMITGKAEGTGLGLSIAQSLVNQHNGLIECTSKPGNTIFSIYLPAE